MLAFGRVDIIFMEEIDPEAQQNRGISRDFPDVIADAPVPVGPVGQWPRCAEVWTLAHPCTVEKQKGVWLTDNCKFSVLERSLKPTNLHEATTDISLCSDSCVVGFYQWLLRRMSANANLSMDMRWAELAELAELGAEKEEKDKGHKDMWRISSDQEIDRISLQNLYVRRWRKWRTLPMWGHRGGLSLDLTSMGRWAWLDIHPKNPHVLRSMKKIVRLMADSIEKKTVFNIDIHNIGRVEI